MAAITWANVVDFDSGLSGVDADAQTAILAFVNVEHDVDAFDGEDGPKLKLVRIYLAAHLGRTIGAAGAATGLVTSASAGGLSVSYGSFSTSAEALGTTGWGNLYLALVKRSAATVGFVA